MLDGFLIDQGLPITDRYDFELTGFPGISESEEEQDLFQNINSEWISNIEYGAIFKHLQPTPSDPQVLVVSGTVSSIGQVALQPTFFIPDGVATPVNAAATGVVQTIGSDGSVVAQSSFEPIFNIRTNTGEDEPTNVSPFLVQLPFSQEADLVQIQESGKNISQFNPNSQLLISAIQEIPSSSFNRNPVREQKSLLNQARGPHFRRLSFAGSYIEASESSDFFYGHTSQGTLE